MSLKVTLLKWRYWNVNILGTGLSLCSKSQEKLLLPELVDKKDANIAKRVEKNNLMAVLNYASTQCKIV